MNKDHKQLIAKVDAELEAAGLPSYTEAVELVIKGMQMVEHRGKARLNWLSDAILAIKRIHN